MKQIMDIVFLKKGRRRRHLKHGYWRNLVKKKKKNYKQISPINTEAKISTKITQFSSVSQSCLTLCNPINCSMPGFSVQLPEPAQTHVHRVGDAIQPSHPLLSPSPPVFNLSQHQGLFHWVNSSHQVAKVLEFQLQHQSFQWIFSTDFLKEWLVWSPWSPGDTQESFPPPQFRSINSLALSFLYNPTLTSIHDYWKNHSFD